jgi:hypothetical protein
MDPRPDRSVSYPLPRSQFSIQDVQGRVGYYYIIDADHKRISTKSLSHVAVTLNIAVPGVRNLCFQLHAAVCKYADTVATANVAIPSSASVSNFLNSFESHRKPIISSIAALHRIPIPEKATLESLCCNY